MKKIWITPVLVIALLIGAAGPTMAAQITVDEVLMAVLIDDFKVNDYTADITVGQGLAEEQRGTIVYEKSSKYRMTFTEDENSNPIDKVVVTDSQSATSFDNDADAVAHSDLGLDPMNADFRALYYLSAGAPILYWTFSDGSTAIEEASNGVYNLKLQGADMDLTIRVNIVRRVLTKKTLNLGGGNTIALTFSNFLTVGGVQMPGTQTLDYNVGTLVQRIDIFSNYLLNQNPSPALFQVP